MRRLNILDGLGVSWIDFKLGFRMLAKYPGLTLVGGFAIAFAVWVGAGTFEALRQFVFPVIPLPDSDRIVTLRNWDAVTNRVEARATHDFVAWRKSLKSVEGLGAYRTVERNLIVTEGRGEPAVVAEINASAFGVARVAPLLGRALIETDERPDAPTVAVIGHGLWQKRFEGSPGVIGRSVRIGATTATIVGVMPERFGFPRAHEIWVPLKLDVAANGPRQGPPINIIGRLAPGATVERARAELEQMGRVAAIDFRSTHENLRPQLQTFAESVSAGGMGGMMMVSGNLFVIMLLVLVCANVGLLLFARAATRETEIVVRAALGASRKRIVMQLFAEALVLGGVAAAVGLAAAGYGMRWGLALMRAELQDGAGDYPFWVGGGLSPATFAYAAALTILVAVIAGVLPGLKITRGLSERLKRTTAGGGGASFGGIWTVVIVAQIAITMAFPVATFLVRRDAKRVETYPLPFPVERFLAVRLEMERPATGFDGDTTRAEYVRRFAATSAALEERLLSDPGVGGVAFAKILPRQYHEWNQVEVDQGAVPPPDERGHRMGSVEVDPDYFEVLGVQMVSGRAFHSGDVRPDSRVVIVNKEFVQNVLGGQNAVGRRIRYVRGESDRTSTSEGKPWFEIVGVAPDLGTVSGYGNAGIYHPLVRATSYPVHAAIKVNGDPLTFIPRLRAIATDVDAGLRLTEPMPMRDVVNAELAFYEFWVKITSIVSAIVLVLSLVSIYAVMSFAVSRRTREIGVRVALGASQRRIIGAVFRQPLRQLAIGLGAGVVVLSLLLVAAAGVPSARQVAILFMYAVAVAGVCLLACIVPTRRALAVEPMEALRSD